MSQEYQFFYKLLFWVLAIYGVNQIVVESTLFKPIRVNCKHKLIREIITCFLCNSVWVSFTISYFIWSPFRQAFSSDLYSNGFANVLFSFGECFESLDTFILSASNFFIKLVSTFFDGMIGSTLVWFLHTIEYSINNKGKR